DYYCTLYMGGGISVF
nr:immunoglobulin light chain junction region [Macaca mulatta]MOV94880.1 immunoglobulin light chain junction region [Macaca mulatta]MOV96378.1 immunoglobulin light chain junction region [Macaca mulatta]MOV96405.1 immunoglobulin light chain junction region [Macaca mulatta]MOV96472.1 immunoglobulin light chain junction region [Macaca mulatta]